MSLFNSLRSLAVPLHLFVFLNDIYLNRLQVAVNVASDVEDKYFKEANQRNARRVDSSPRIAAFFLYSLDTLRFLRAVSRFSHLGSVISPFQIIRCVKILSHIFDSRYTTRYVQRYRVVVAT